MRRADTPVAMAASASAGFGGGASKHMSCEATHAETAAPLVVDRGSCPEPGNTWDCWKRSAYARFPLLRSTAFRFGITFWLMFCVIVGVAGYGFYQTLQQGTIDNLDRSLTARHSLMRTIYDSSGMEGLIDFAQARAGSPMTTPMGFYLQSPEGTRVAGNIVISDSAPGLSVLRGSEIGLEVEGSYRFLTMPLDDHLLSIGRSLAPLEDLRSIAVKCLAWAFGGSMLLGFAGAFWIARRSTRRVNGFSNALTLVANGNMGVRVPVSSSMDDIDDMALHVNAALDRLQDSVDSIRQVSTDIAHDLKTPLNRLHISLGEASDNVESMEGERAVAARDALDDAMAEAHHINSTFEALLRVAQVEAGSRRANFASMNLADVLTTATEIYDVVAEESGQELVSLVGPSTQLSVNGDKELMMQLVVNLLENASHHSPEGTRIEVDGGSDEDMVWFSVSDNGPGIPVDEQDKVFRRLYRLERSRTTRGSGLGLNMVKAITELHGGAIKLEDNGPGLKVTVKFCPHGGTAKPF